MKFETLIMHTKQQKNSFFHWLDNHVDHLYLCISCDRSVLWAHLSLPLELTLVLKLHYMSNQPNKRDLEGIRDTRKTTTNIHFMLVK